MTISHNIAHGRWLFSEAVEEEFDLFVGTPVECEMNHQFSFDSMLHVYEVSGMNLESYLSLSNLGIVADGIVWWEDDSLWTMR